MTKITKNKPVVEAGINGAALILISMGTQQIVTGNLMGYPMVVFGVALEYAKYYGRKKKLWK